MARTASKKKEIDPLTAYNKLSLVNQRLVWLFYRGQETKTNGTCTYGLDPEGSPASVHNWKASGAVRTYIKQSQWRYRALVSFGPNVSLMLSLLLSSSQFLTLSSYISSSQKAAQIALRLHEKDISIEEPYLPKEGETSPVHEDEDHNESEATYEEEEEEEEEVAESPRPTMNAVTMKMKRATIQDDCCRDIKFSSSGSLTPYVVGKWSTMDLSAPFLQRTTEHFVMVRVLVHDGVDKDAVTLEWQDDSRTLKVGVTWPDWFGNVADHQLSFSSVESRPGQPPRQMFGKDHELIKSMTQNVISKVENGADQVRDFRFLKFDSQMSTKPSDVQSEVLNVTVNGTPKSAKVIQITAKVAGQEDKHYIKVGTRDVTTEAQTG